MSDDVTSDNVLGSLLGGDFSPPEGETSSSQELTPEVDRLMDIFSNGEKSKSDRTRALKQLIRLLRD